MLRKTIILLFFAGLATFGGQPSAVAAFSVAAASAKKTVSSSPPQLFLSHFDKTSLSANTAALTYLEINGWLLSTGGITILIDPLLEGALDFGIPAIYSASKRSLPSTGLCESLPPIDCLLITQGLDDHAHERTLKKLAKMDGSVSIVAPPSARGALERSGFLSSNTDSNISFIRPGEDIVVNKRSTIGDSKEEGVKIRATTGALVGPPWQARENGYVIRPLADGSGSSNGPSVYIEPHVEFNDKELKREAPIDAVITPISGQGLPAFELVHGPSDALRLIQTLRPKYIIPMQNGDVDAEGFASPLVQSVGSPDEFRRMLDRIQNTGGQQSKAEIVTPIVPGEDIILQA